MPVEPITIRRAHPGDIPALVELLGELFSIEADFQPDAAKQRRGLEQLLDNAYALVLVAESSGDVAGMCTVQMLTSTAEGGPAGLVEDMVVAEDYRRRGIGRALLGAAEDWAAGRGLTRLHLLAESANTAALGFYRAVGWQDTGLACLRKALPSLR